jgi:hypothetical protein
MRAETHSTLITCQTPTAALSATSFQDPVPTKLEGPCVPMKGPVGEGPHVPDGKVGSGGRGRGQIDPRNSLRRVLRRASAETRVARPASKIPFFLNEGGLVRREGCGNAWVTVVGGGRAGGGGRAQEGWWRWHWQQ